MFSLKWGHGHVYVSPTPNSRAWLRQGEESWKEQWNLIWPFIHLSCSEQSRAAQLRRAHAPCKTCVRQLPPCTGVANYFWSFGGCFHFGQSLSQVIPSRPPRAELVRAGGKVADAAVCSSFCRLVSWYAQAAEMHLLFEHSLVRLLKTVSASLATNWVSRWSRTENFLLWRHQINC